jgi:homoserine O-acetyltransferase/O-succinyltransferase
VRFVGSFDANSHRYLSRAMDRFEMWSHGPGVLQRAALDSALVIEVQSDMLFAIEEQRALAAELSRAQVAARFVELSCIQGHDSFLIDLKQFGTAIRAYLA